MNIFYVRIRIATGIIMFVCFLIKSIFIYFYKKHDRESRESVNNPEKGECNQNVSQP